MRLGPEADNQLQRFGFVYKQGQHTLITGGTGSGKTELARQVVQKRIEKGGHVIVFVAKPRDDETIVKSYSKKDGWIRYTRWPPFFRSLETKILIYPDVTKYEGRDLLRHQKEVFQKAFDKVGKIGTYTLQVDEGLYTCSSRSLNMSNDLAQLFNMGRTSNLSIVLNAQRPSHLPLESYANSAHVFAGRTRESADLKRLAEIGGKYSVKELTGKLSNQGFHDFLWIPVVTDGEPERVNLAV
jgi:energy-coupling factor transporter ATP-binding protein EcfA2